MKRQIIIAGMLLLAVLSKAYGQEESQPVDSLAALNWLDSEGKSDGSKGQPRLYPNPVESTLNVLCDACDIEQVKIFSNAGEQVFASLMPIPKGARLTINMSLYATGYYVVKIWSKGTKIPLTRSVYKL
ncbi:MAG: T9SS type A sorting domain-containing protein [Prevotellaceae bacterium]|jgi:hypothetical protein|nr:T9SS type A sorting domain-containing protein [Prevotellaceae bacterium]